MLERALLVMLPGIIGLILLQILHLWDASKRSKSVLPRKSLWLALMAIPVLGGFAATYYYIFVLPKLREISASRSTRKSKAATKGSLISQPSKPSAKSSPERPPKSSKKTPSAESPPPKVDAPQSKPSAAPPPTPPKSPAKTSPKKAPQPPTRPAESIATQVKAKHPNLKLDPVADNPKKIEGYGDDRRNRIIETNAAEAPIDGRPRVHEVDKVNVREDGLLITDGLNRRLLKWDEIFIVIGAQSPIGVRDKLMIDMFVEGLVAPYRIFDDVIMYQDFRTDISFNIEDNFRSFVRYLVERIPEAVIEPDTIEFAQDDDKHFPHQFRKYHDFDLYVWKIRNQVLSQTGDEPPAEAAPAPKPAAPPQPDPVDETYALILREIESGKEKLVLQLIMHLYKCDAATAKKFLKTPSIVGRNLSRENAGKIQKELQKRGAVAQAVTMTQLQKLRKP